MRGPGRIHSPRPFYFFAGSTRTPIASAKTTSTKSPGFSLRTNCCIPASATGATTCRPRGPVKAAFPALMLESPTAAMTAVQASNAVAGTTIVLAEAAIAAGQVVALPWRAPWMEAQLGILRLRNHQPSEAEAAFLDLLRSADEEAARRGRRFLAAHGFEPTA